MCPPTYMYTTANTYKNPIYFQYDSVTTFSYSWSTKITLPGLYM